MQRMIQHQSVLLCADPTVTPTQHVCVQYRGQRAHYTTTRNSMHKMWGFFLPFSKPYFHHKNSLDRRVPTVKLRSIQSKVNSPLKITKLFQF